VFTHPTVRALAAALDEGDPLPAQAGLVTLRAAGERAPLYLIHQAGGYIHSYFALARHLGEDRPILGLQPPGLHGAVPPLATLGELARCHLQAIVRRQPRGPYHLAGHSLGGVIAYEMARQLIAAREQVAYLGLIDSHLPTGEPDEPDPRGAFGFLIEQIESRFGQPLGLELEPGGDPAAWIAATARALARAGIADEATAHPHVLGLYQVFATSVTAYRSYRAEPCAVAAHLYQTGALASTLAARPDLAWERWALGGVARHDIPGAHLDLLAEPHATALGAAMAEHLHSPAGPERPEAGGHG
jgi:thioesterase domain-containing protein